MPDSRTAKLFIHGRSQAVRLPKEFRLPGKEVRVSRQGRRVILEPIGREPAEVLSVFTEIDRLLEGGSYPEAEPGDDRAILPDRRVFFDQ